MEFNKNTLNSPKALTVEKKSFLNFLCASCGTYFQIDSLFKMAMFIGICYGFWPLLYHSHDKMLDYGLIKDFIMHYVMCIIICKKVCHMKEIVCAANMSLRYAGILGKDHMTEPMRDKGTQDRQSA